jgi:hypothetical protein
VNVVFVDIKQNLNASKKNVNAAVISICVQDKLKRYFDSFMNPSQKNNLELTLSAML